MAGRVELPIVVLNDQAPYNPVEGASCVVINRATGTEATVFSDEGTTNNTTSQPLSTDSAGRLTGWLPRGRYKLQITIPGRSPYVENFDAAPGQDGAISTSWLEDGAVTGVKIAAAIKDAASGTASLRTLGTGAAQAAAGNDSRLSNERTPSNGSVTTAKIVDGNVTTAKIEDKAITKAKTSEEVQTLLGVAKKLSVPGQEELTVNTSEWKSFPTADKVSGIVIGTDGILNINFRSELQQFNGGIPEFIRAAIFITKEGGSAEQLRVFRNNNVVVQEAALKSVGVWVPLVTWQGGLAVVPLTLWSGFGTAPLALGIPSGPELNYQVNAETGANLTTTSGAEGITRVERLAAGNYSAEIKYKAVSTGSGKLLSRNRLLRAWSQGFI